MCEESRRERIPPPLPLPLWVKGGCARARVFYDLCGLRCTPVRPDGRQGEAQAQNVRRLIEDVPTAAYTLDMSCIIINRLVKALNSINYEVSE